jgi:hypothetical protein
VPALAVKINPDKLFVFNVIDLDKFKLNFIGFEMGLFIHVWVADRNLLNFRQGNELVVFSDECRQICQVLDIFLVLRNFIFDVFEVLGVESFPQVFGVIFELLNGFITRLDAMLNSFFKVLNTLVKYGLSNGWEELLAIGHNIIGWLGFNLVDNFLYLMSRDVEVNFEQGIGIRVEVVLFLVLGERLPHSHFMQVESDFGFGRAMIYLIGGFGEFGLELLFGRLILLGVDGDCGADCVGSDCRLLGGVLFLQPHVTLHLILILHTCVINDLLKPLGNLTIIQIVNISQVEFHHVPHVVTILHHTYLSL